MKPMNVFLRLLFLAIVTLTWGCRDDGDSYEKITATGKTRLFDAVTAPEPAGSNEGSGRLGLSLSDSYSGSTGGGMGSGSGTWGGGNPNGTFQPGVLTAGEWSDLDNWTFWNELLSNQEYYKDVNK